MDLDEFCQKMKPFSVDKWKQDEQELTPIEKTGLRSILGALRAIVNVIGMTKMTPPIRDLLPRLTPILRNRHEKVQENCIDLVSEC